MTPSKENQPMQNDRDYDQRETVTFMVFALFITVLMIGAAIVIGLMV